MINRMQLCTAFAVAAFSGMTIPATASEIFDPSVSTCTGADCSSVQIGGTVTNPSNNNHPWVINTFAAAGECVRLRVLSQAADLEMTVVSPDGSVFRNDDGGLAPCALCSLVKFVAPSRGWYTVQVSHFGGTPTYSDLQLAYGRYNGANPNCASPTVPALAAAAELAAPSVKASGRSDTSGLGAGTAGR
jgi:hypothetical protein